QPASDGDTDTIHRTLAEAQSAAREINERAVDNISLLLRKHLGKGKPRQFQGLSREFFAFYFLILAEFSRAMAESETASTALPSKPSIPRLTFQRSLPDSRRALPPCCHSRTATTATGC